MAVTYADSGVDIPAADRAKQRIRQLARSTFNSRVLAEIGGFGGLFRLPAGFRRPVLVSSIDGVGTKLKIAFQLNRHDTVGRDLVNHCVNDILVQGALPLFFLDYLALGRMQPDTVASVIEGITRGCRENACVLIGGETAEMPGFYAPGEYDLAGCIVGIADESRLLTGARVRPGDRLIGLRSAGLHTNGYSLARRVLFDIAGLKPGDYIDDLRATVGDALLAEHRSYLHLLKPLLFVPAGVNGKASRNGKAGRNGKASLGAAIHALAHITGGGITENLPRVLPANCAAEIDTSAWEIPPLFRLLQQLGQIPLDDMRRTFNLGIGMIAVAAAAQADALTAWLRRRGEDPVALGRIVAAGAARQPAAPFEINEASIAAAKPGATKAPLERQSRRTSSRPSQPGSRRLGHPAARGLIHPRVRYV